MHISELLHVTHVNELLGPSLVIGSIINCIQRSTSGFYVGPFAQDGRTLVHRSGIPFHPVPYRRWIMDLISHQTRKIIISNAIRTFRITNISKSSTGAVKMGCSVGTNGKTRIHVLRCLILHHPHDRTKTVDLSAIMNLQVMRYSNQFLL